MWRAKHNDHPANHNDHPANHSDKLSIHIIAWRKHNGDGFPNCDLVIVRDINIKHNHSDHGDRDDNCNDQDYDAARLMYEALRLCWDRLLQQHSLYVSCVKLIL